MTWRIYSADGKFHWLRDDDGFVIAASEDEQRIRLLGAAPQMLETLCSIRDQAECFMQPLPDGVARARWEAVRNRAVAAIAAVKGKTDVKEAQAKQ